MNKEELEKRLVELTKVLCRIEQLLTRMMGKGTREWLSAYYNATNGIPSCFTPEQWRESEKIIYDSLVNEINGDFQESGNFRSSRRVELLDMFKKEREKMLEVRKK